jgi:hypothetical protein
MTTQDLQRKERRRSERDHPQNTIFVSHRAEAMLQPYSDHPPQGKPCTVALEHQTLPTVENARVLEPGRARRQLSFRQQRIYRSHNV